MTRELWLISFVLLLLSFNITLFLTPLTRKLSITRRYSDKKEKRKVHKKIITRLGGAAIYGGILFSFLLLYLLGQLRAEIPCLLIGVTIIFIIGVLDDIRGVPAHFKLIAQLSASFAVIPCGFRIETFTVPFSESSIILPIIASYIVTITWILLITNAVNFIDGLDGLAAGIVLIAAVSLFGISIRSDRPDIAIPFTAVAGSCLGFLRHNFHPAKVFMGDAGSTSIGFTIACLTLFGTIKSPAVFPLMVPLIALGIPATDVCFAVLRRIKNKQSPFRPDKNHLHHKLLATGFQHKDVVLLLYFFTMILGVIAFSISPSPSLATISFAAVGIGILLISIRRVYSRRKC